MTYKIINCIYSVFLLFRRRSRNQYPIFSNKIAVFFFISYFYWIGLWLLLRRIIPITNSVVVTLLICSNYTRTKHEQYYYRDLFATFLLVASNYIFIQSASLCLWYVGLSFLYSVIFNLCRNYICPLQNLQLLKRRRALFF